MVAMNDDLALWTEKDPINTKYASSCCLNIKVTNDA